MNDHITSPGEAAYGRYAEVTGWKTWDGRDMPAWADLTPKIQQAWEAAGGLGGALPFRPGDILVMRVWNVSAADRHLIEKAAVALGTGGVLFIPPGVDAIMALRPEGPRNLTSAEIYGLCRAEGPLGELCDRLAGHTPSEDHSWYFPEDPDSG